MTLRSRTARILLSTAALALVAGWWSVRGLAQASQKPFVLLEAPFTQELYGASGHIFDMPGAVAVSVPSGPETLTGTVFDDANSNGLFDTGEGVAGAPVYVDFAGDPTTLTGPDGSFSVTLAAGDHQISSDFAHPSLVITGHTSPVRYTGVGILGGVAFGPGGVVWSSECWFSGSFMHKFAPTADTANPVHGSALHPEEVVDISDVGPYANPAGPDGNITLPVGAGGCGIVNHQDGYIYANSQYGIWKLDATSGRPVNPTNNHILMPGDAPPADGGVVGGASAVPGNALGIAVDPQTWTGDPASTHHLVYIGADCHPTLSPTSTTCTLFDLDPATGVTQVFARITRPAHAFIDGLYFSPDGGFVFAAYRDEALSLAQNALYIFRRPAALKPAAAAVDDTQVVNSVPMASEPDGVAFHPANAVSGTGAFVVTLNESDDPTPDPLHPEYAGGSMTKFVFPHGFDAKLPDGSPDVVLSAFALGGFRGDLLQVGADQCLYGTQGEFSNREDAMGVRYADGTTGRANSLVRICEAGGGFATPPGVPPFNNQETTPAHLTLVKHVVNDNSGHAVATDFTLTATSAATSFSGAGGFSLDVPAGTYDLSETTLAGYNPSAWSCTGGTLSGSAVTLADGASATCEITNDDQPPAHLTLVKVVVNDNGGAAAATDFTLSASGPTPLTGAGGASGDVEPGTYTLSETSLPGYSASDWSCDGTTLTGTSLTLASGQSATCTITNDDQPAHLAVIKHVVNDNGGTASAGAWTMNVTAGHPSNNGFAGSEAGVTITLDAGSFSVAESGGPAGYQQTSAVGCAGTLALGESATCTLVNDDQPAHLTVIKHVVNDNNGTASAGAWTMNVTAGHPSTNGFAGSEAGVTITLDAGSYSVVESGGPAGYQQTSAVGCAGTLALGGSATCTLVNDDVPPPPPVCSGTIGDFVWMDLNRNGLQDAGEPGIANTSVTLKNASGVVLQNATTGANGSYGFTNLCAGSYSVEASTPVGLDRTATIVGSNPAIDSNANPSTVTLASNTSDLTVDFGFVNGFCEKLPVQTVLDPAGSQFPGNRGPDSIVRVHKGDSVQTAVTNAADTNGDGYIIVAVVAKEGGKLGGDVTQQVVISRQYTAPFALIGCSVTLHDPTPGDGSPTARVLSTASAPADGIGARIFVMDLHASDSAVAGWLVEGNNRYVRNTYGKNNAVGVKFVGNSNTMHNGSVESNTGVGLYIQGNNNYVTDTNAMSNGSHGVFVSGSTNQILKVDAGESGTGNGGDGVHVEGAGNLIQEASAFANGGDGIEVVASTGTPNIVLKNVAGDRNKGNTGNGILVSGPGNGTASPIELEQNTTKSNGLVGVKITGTGHQLKNNVSGGTGSGDTNIGCEFNVGTGNFNATGNKANGTTVPGSNGSAFPTGCVGS